MVIFQKGLKFKNEADLWLIAKFRSDSQIVKFDLI